MPLRVLEMRYAAVDDDGNVIVEVERIGTTESWQVTTPIGSDVVRVLPDKDAAFALGVEVAELYMAAQSFEQQAGEARAAASAALDEPIVRAAEPADLIRP